MPLWLTENGDIVVILSRLEIVVYDGNKKLRERGGDWGRDWVNSNYMPLTCDKSIVYVESLVSP